MAGTNNALNRIISWGMRTSPGLFLFHGGACGGCAEEITDAAADWERFGISLQASPRHADILLCTGAVTQKNKDILLQIYEQMPEPKMVLAVGSCACSGGVYSGCYAVVGGVEKVIPVDAYLPGCPVNPETIYQAIQKILQRFTPSSDGDEE